jgi:hypothetical protein
MQGMATDSQPSFRRGVPRLLARRENERIDDVFQTLLSEANLIFFRRPARRHLTEANLRGYFRNAYAVWTT